MDRRADGGFDADPVPRNARVVRTSRRPERIDDRATALDRPIETAEVGGGDRPGRGRDAARLRLAPRPFERLDPVVERFLVAVETRQPFLCLSGVTSRLPQICFPLMLEREVAPQLVRALVAPAAQRLARVDEELALARDAVAQLAHVVGEQLVLPADEIEVLVAGEQVAEAFGREQHLPAVQRTALVDVHEPPFQHRALFEQRILRDQQIHRDQVDLPAESRDLTVQLIDDAIGGLLLRFNVGDLVRERVRLRAEPRELLFDFGALATNALEAALIILHLLLVGGTLRGRGLCDEKEYDARRATHDRSHTRLRCLPTLIALPKSPIRAPKATIATACS